MEGGGIRWWRRGKKKIRLRVLRKGTPGAADRRKETEWGRIDMEKGKRRPEKPISSHGKKKASLSLAVKVTIIFS